MALTKPSDQGHAFSGPQNLLGQQEKQMRENRQTNKEDGSHGL